MTSPSTSITSGTLARCIPRRTKQEEEQTVSVLHSCEPDWHSTWSKRNWVRSESTQNRTVQTNFEISSQNSILVQFTACSEKGIAIYQTRSHAISLSDTLPVICTDRVVCMQSREEFYCKTYRSPSYHEWHLCRTCNTLRRMYLFLNREKSDDREEDHHRETCGSECCFDFRIPGIPRSAVEEVETMEGRQITGRWCPMIPRNRRRSTTSVENQKNLMTEIGKSEYLRVLRDFFEKTMFRLRLMFGNWYRRLHMRKMLATVQQRQIWLTPCPLLDTWWRRTNPEVLGMVKQCVK